MIKKLSITRKQSLHYQKRRTHARERSQAVFICYRGVPGHNQSYIFFQTTSYLNINTITYDYDSIGNRLNCTILTWSDQAVEINHGLVKVHAISRGVDVENASVYLFTENSSYLQQSVKTDISGKAEFLIPEGSYKFRVDYNGVQHWSNAVQIAANGQIIVEVEDN